MLSRVADSLYWIGRNLERAEHCSRFLKVQYFSTLDTPMIRNKDFTLRSIMFMAGTNFQSQGGIMEQEIWKNVIFDINNPNSIFSVIKNARENARSIRNSISTELWESINKLYLYCSNYEEQKFSAGKIYDFTEDMRTHIAMIKSTIQNTILHDDCYHFIKLGLFVERSIQVLRIVRGKISDWSILSENGMNKALISYQWTILLKSIEGFDIYNKLHPGKKSIENIFRMIFMNDLFPRSMAYSLNNIRMGLRKISVRPQGYDAMIESFDKKTLSMQSFDDFDDEDKVLEYVHQVIERISKIHNDIANMYFN
ncbi:alpha-E domain-containing protein [Portibacter marinus]|uniref:alpha-E domain-containing protein n=1 Tax=Portibacter marinus TaxID=2898660 RepID=UPI001F174400|nr:alpha-E domain-containing protein [Portibacter marinus]